MLGCQHSPSVRGVVARRKSRQKIASRGWGRDRDSRTRVASVVASVSRERGVAKVSREWGSRNGVAKWGREWESRMGVAKIKNLGAYVNGIPKGVII